MRREGHIAARWSAVPLPLVQLLQASRCAKTAPERFFFARQLWETIIQFLGAVCLLSWSHRQAETSPMPGTLSSSWRLDAEEPSASSAQTTSTHWWRWIRLLLPGLSNSNDPFALRLREWLYSDCPLLESCWLSELSQLFGFSATTACPRTPATWFEHYLLSAPTIAAFESGQHSVQEWNNKSQALVHALTDLLTPGNFFTQARLVFVSRVEREGQANYRLERLELSGESPRWLPPLITSFTEETTPPNPGRLYLELFPNSLDIKALLNRSHSRCEHETPWSALCLYPLVLYQFGSEETFFLQSLYGQKEAVFVAPTTGRVHVHASVSEAVSRLVEKLAQHPTTTELTKRWLGALNREPAYSGNSNRETSGQPTRFELLSELPSGPDAVEYRAWQLSVHRPVRLRCLIQTEKRCSLAEEELAILHGLVRLHHPHLIKVYDHDISEGMAFIATEFVPGISLASIVEKLQPRQRQSLPTWSDWLRAVRLAWQDESRRERPLCDLHTYEHQLARYLTTPPWPESGSDNPDTASGQRQYVRNLLELISQIADAVQSLHDSGLVHGSITPGRILLAYEDARPILLEPSCSWDLAQFLRFLSAERRFGSSRLTRQADLYSLAAITLELLTFNVENVATLDHAIHVRSAEQLGLPKELIIFLKQYVAPNLEECPDSAREFARQLREFARQFAPAESSPVPVAFPSSAKETTPRPDASPAPTTSASDASVPVRQAVKDQSRRGRHLLAGFGTLGLGAVLTVAAFCMLTWWVGLQPRQLLRLLVQRSQANWFGTTERVAHGTSPSISHTSSPSPPDSQTALTSSAATPPNHAEIIESLHKQLQAERHRADELAAQLQVQCDLISQQNARIQELEKTLASFSQNNKQQPDHQQSQPRSQPTEADPTKPNLEVPASQLAELKRLQEELAGLTLKLETIAAENHSLRQAQQRVLGVSLEFLYHWLQAINQSTLRHPLTRRAPRPYLVLLRDELNGQLKNFDSNKIPPLVLASAYLKLGLLEYDLGSYKSAQNAYQQAFKLLNALPNETRQSAEYQVLLYSVHQATARLWFDQKQYQEAEAAWLQALSGATRCCKELNQPERWSAELARCHEQLGTVYRLSRQLDKAQSAYQNAIRLWKKLHEQRDEEPAYVLALARCYQGLAYVAELRDQVEVAEQNYQQAISLLEDLRAHQPQHREATLALAQLLAERAALYRDSGQPEKSLSWFQRAIELLRPLATSGPDSLDALVILRDIYAGRAHAFTSLKRYAEALPDWEEAIACDCERLPTLRAYRAICLARLGNAERAAHEAKRLAQEQPVTGSLLYNLACVHAVLAETLAPKSQAASPESNRQRDAHVARAFELLQQAADLGYFRNPHRLDYLQRDPDLDCLRHLDEFKRLLEKLSAKE